MCSIRRMECTITRCGGSIWRSMCRCCLSKAQAWRPALRSDADREFGAVGGAVVDVLGGFLEVGGEGLGDLHELLRIAVGEGEPRTLHLDHDAVTRAEGVGDVGHGEGDAIRFAGLEGDGLFEALAEFTAEGFAAYQLLIAA